MCQHCKGITQAFDQVKDFHLAFNHPVSEHPTSLTPNRVRDRYVWMQEELTEFLTANSIDGQADAMIDLIYFALGTLVEMGIEPKPLFDIVQNANMSKLFPDGKPRFREDGKVVKPDTWKSPEIYIIEEIARQAKK